MIGQDDIFSALESALRFEKTSVIVRSSSVIAEIHGLLTVWRGTEWVTLGEEGGTHVHLKLEAGCRLRYRQSDDKNAALEFTGAGGELLCRVTFRGTNRAKTGQYDPARAAMVCEQFSHLANERAAT